MILQIGWINMLDGLLKLSNSAKGTLSCFIILVSAYLCLHGHLEGGHFVAIITTVASIFLASHTATDITTLKLGK